MLDRRHGLVCTAEALSVIDAIFLHNVALVGLSRLNTVLQCGRLGRKIVYRSILLLECLLKLTNHPSLHLIQLIELLLMFSLFHPVFVFDRLVRSLNRLHILLMVVLGLEVGLFPACKRVRGILLLGVEIGVAELGHRGFEIGRVHLGGEARIEVTLVSGVFRLLDVLLRLVFPTVVHLVLELSVRLNSFKVVFPFGVLLVPAVGDRFGEIGRFLSDGDLSGEAVLLILQLLQPVLHKELLLLPLLQQQLLLKLSRRLKISGPIVDPVRA